jgi:hypothetical protein
MTVNEAAQFLSCSPGHVRRLVGACKLKYKKKKPPKGCTSIARKAYNAKGYMLDIPKQEVERYKQLRFNMGWKRGRPRKGRYADGSAKRARRGGTVFDRLSEE